MHICHTPNRVNFSKPKYQFQISNQFSVSVCAGSYSPKIYHWTWGRGCGPHGSHLYRYLGVTPFSHRHKNRSTVYLQIIDSRRRPWLITSRIIHSGLCATGCPFSTTQLLPVSGLITDRSPPNSCLSPASSLIGHHPTLACSRPHHWSVTNPTLACPRPHHWSVAALTGSYSLHSHLSHC